MKTTERKWIFVFTAVFLLLAAGILFFVFFSGSVSSRGEKVSLTESDDPALLIRSAERGDLLQLGTYEQDGDVSNGAEPIEWMVLDKIDDELLLISRDCLDWKRYNHIPFQPVTWEDSAVRKWLNDEFYESAFSDAEKSFVMLAENQNPDQSAVGTRGGRETSDHVFLLCEKEAGIYFGNEMDQDYVGRAPATEYAISNGAVIDDTGMAEWWLRTPGAYEYSAQFVETSGAVYVPGAYVDIFYAVRPAVWLDAGAE